MNKEILHAGIAALSAAIEQEPSAALYKERGRLKMLAGDQQGAIQDYGKATEMDPSLLKDLCGKFNVE